MRVHFHFCQSVGCDLVVESRANKDICGVCKGDNSTCELVDNTFTTQPRKNSKNNSVRMLKKSMDTFIIKSDTIKEIIKVFNEILKREFSWMFSFCKLDNVINCCNRRTHSNQDLFFYVSFFQHIKCCGKTVLISQSNEERISVKKVINHQKQRCNCY